MITIISLLSNFCVYISILTSSYDNKEKFIECFFTVKLKDFNIMQFEQWKREINKLNISLRYKNDIYKFLKSILNFGIK